jgi:hypothetical protein
MSNDLAIVRAELAPETTQATAMLQAFQSLEVQTPDDLAFAGEMLTSVKARFNALEERRTAITKPMNAALREVNALFKPVQEPLEKAEGILKGKIGQYHLAQREANERAMFAASAAAVAGDGAGAATALATMAEAPKTTGVGVREVWDWEVSDLDAVPREYLAIDPVKVKVARGMYMTADMAAVPPIPGIRFFRRAIVAVRGT